MYGALTFKPKLKEYLISTGEEAEADTLFYLRHARRLAQDNATPHEKMEEELDHAFVALGFSNANKGADSAIGDKQADKMLKAYQQKARDEGGPAVAENPEEAGIEEETKENAAENRILEEFINANHNNASKISAQYKLFDIVTAKNPS